MEPYTKLPSADASSSLPSRQRDLTVQRGIRRYACAALLLMSCGVDGALEHSQVSYLGQGILNGVEEPGYSSVVGILMTQQDAGPGLCTGTLIAPNLVLTARHCVAPAGEQVLCSSSTFGSPYDAASLYVTTDALGLETAARTQEMTGNWYRANRIIVSENDKICGNDMALIQLKGAGIPSSVATPIVPRIDSEVKAGERYTAIGFGAVNDQGAGYGRRRSRENLEVKCVGNCTGLFVDTTHEWQGNEGVCQGDSGGPSLDSQDRVMGVVSRGASGCQIPVYGSVFAWRVWLKRGALEAAQAGRYTPATWVTSAPTPGAGAMGEGGSSAGATGGDDPGVDQDDAGVDGFDRGMPDQDASSVTRSAPGCNVTFHHASTGALTWAWSAAFAGLLLRRRRC